MNKTFQVLPITVKIKTRNHNVVDVAPTFLSNLMFYYSSYLLCFSPPGHFSIYWMYYSVPFSWRVLCVHTLSILTLQIWALQGNLFGCSRQTWWSPKYILYALMYFFSLICMSIWLFPLPFKYHASEVVPVLFTVVWSSEQWRSGIQCLYNKWIWVVSACYGLNCVLLKFHVLEVLNQYFMMWLFLGYSPFKEVIKVKWSHMIGPWSNMIDVLKRWLGTQTHKKGKTLTTLEEDSHLQAKEIKKPTLLTPWSYNLRNCEKINCCCLSNPGWHFVALENWQILLLGSGMLL